MEKEETDLDDLTTVSGPQWLMFKIHYLGFPHRCEDWLCSSNTTGVATESDRAIDGRIAMS